MTEMLFSLGTGKTPEPELGGPEVVMVRVKNAAQDKKPRKMSRSTETGSSATDDVTDDVSKLFFNRYIIATDGCVTIIDKVRKKAIKVFDKDTIHVEAELSVGLFLSTQPNPLHNGHDTAKPTVR